jgi:two-component system, LuxR family, sensor kinase FixL
MSSQPDTPPTNENLVDCHLQLQAIFDAYPDLLFRLGRDGTILEYHAGRPELLYLPPEDFCGRRFSEVLPPPVAEVLMRSFERILAGESLAICDYRLPFPEGDRFFEARFISVTTGDVVVIVRDTSEVKAAFGAILNVAEEERRRIGQDLHDVIGQELAGSLMLARMLQRDLQSSGAAEAVAADKLIASLERALNHARTLSRGLVPADLQPHELTGALTELALRISDMHGIDCAVDCPADLLPTDSLTATQLYRIAHEAVTNAVKHGQATKIEISFRADDHSIVLQITDNGAGIPEKDQQGQGIGLQIMNYRARLISGHLETKPAEPGTVVSCRLPAAHQ